VFGIGREGKNGGGKNSLTNIWLRHWDFLPDPDRVADGAAPGWGDEPAGLGVAAGSAGARLAGME